MTDRYEYQIIELEVPLASDGDYTPEANHALDHLEAALRLVVVQTRNDKPWNPALFEEYYGDLFDEYYGEER